MVENNAGGTWTEFVYGPTGAKLAKCNGQTLVKAFVALPGGAKAIYTSTGLAYFRHTDWLGSSRLTSTATAPTQMYSTSAYGPFGEQYANSGSADASFTGQDQDTVNGLYDFAMRRYSPSQGRWISPDPAGLAALNLKRPQTWNRYVYSENNPLAYIDEDGTSDDGCGEDDDSCDGGGGDDGGGNDGSGDDGSGDDNSGGDPCQQDPSVCYGFGNTPPPPPDWLVQLIQDNIDNMDMPTSPCAEGLQRAGADIAGLDRVNANWDTIQDAADANNVDPALLGAIILRESDARNINENDGAGVGVGWFQLTVSPGSGVTADCAMSLACAANEAAQMLASNMDYLDSTFPTYAASGTLLQATAASYNMNPYKRGNVTGNPATIDIGTARSNHEPVGNYGSNVMQLMDCF